MALIYHVTTEQEWAAAKQNGFYTAPSLQIEGFIHCSEAQQVQAVLQRYYQGKTNLLKLVIDTNKLKSKLQYDLAPSVNEEFPHVYGPLNLDAVINTEMISQ